LRAERESEKYKEKGERYRKQDEEKKREKIQEILEIIAS